MRAALFAITVLVAAMVSGSSDLLPDPFGGHTVAALNGPLVTAWYSVRGELLGDHALLGACVDSTTAPCARARALWQIINDAKEQRGIAMIGHLNRAINLSIVPFEPSEWLTGLDAMKGAGDCQAFATAKYFALREAGVAPERVRLVIVHAAGHVEDHMVTAVHFEGRWLILDNGTLTLVPDTESGYTPLFVFDDDGVRRYVPTPTS